VGVHFHYHAAPRDTPRLGIRRGDRLCHVFSDAPDLSTAADELRTWARAHLPPEVRLQEPGTRRQHYDLWAAFLTICGPPAPRETMRRWLRPP
jgi:hypothetical protein